MRSPTFAALAASMALATSPATASDAPDFDAAQYCGSVDRSAPKTVPSDIAVLLEDDAPAADGFTIANAVLVSAAVDIAHAAPDTQACQAIFEGGAARFEEVHAQALANVRSQKKHKFKRKDPIRTIQQRLADHWVADQAGRLAYLRLRTDDKVGADFWAARLSVANSRRSDESAKRYIAQVLEQYDWIDKKRFGSVYSDHAWILVQHADSDPAFQADVLARMEPYLETGGVRKKHYAYLYDRVAVNTGRLQRYGTQPTWECDNGSMELKPLEDPEGVNARRKLMGLNSVEEGLATMEQQICGG